MISQQLLVKAAKLLDFGAKSIEAQNIDLRKLKGARSLFFQMIVAAHSYAETVYILCERNRTSACGGLLRSLLENLINIRSLYSAPREHHHIIFLHGVIEKRKQQNHALEFLNKNPQYQDQGFSITELSKARDATVTQENVYTKKVNRQKMKLIESVIERTKYVDEHNKKKRQKSESLERLYFNIYRTLSAATHMNFLSFQDHFKLENSQIVVMLSGDPDKVEHFLRVLIYLYTETLDAFLKIFKSPLRKQFNKKDYAG